MTTLPEEVNHAWESREKRAILTTVDPDGVPNAIYVTCVNRFDEDTFVIADNYFNKTRANILAGCKTAVLLFITNEGESFQLKGPVEYHTFGEIFDDMKQWNPKKHPGHAAVAIKVKDVFSGAKKIV